MSKEYEIEIDSINSIYKKSITNDYGRKLKVHFSIPDDINQDTGILTYISGFGGNANSSVCKKMRKEFADKYNLVTIQCDYFGYEFMQSDIDNIYLPNKDIIKEKSKVFNKEDMKSILKENGNIDFDKFFSIAVNYDMQLDVYANLHNESIDYFNDMGIMQALDNIISILCVMNILYDNKYKFNAKKIILFGNSHGSYLSYLCNALAPGLISLIIDNSAWIYPKYLIQGINRVLIRQYGKLSLNQRFDYKAKTIIDDKEILDLNNIYTQFENKCNIVSYHGDTDNLININTKKNFCSKINNCIFNEITSKKVDGNVFKSTDHGLGADFLKLFELTMNNLDFEFDKGYNFDLPHEVIYETKKNKYIIDYENVLPIVGIIPKQKERIL